MSFLPENYKTPKTSDNYMKLQDGENRIRILTAPILGWEYWHVEDNGNKKPIRSPFDVKPSKGLNGKDLAPEEVRHFWSMVVYNCTEDQIQILQINQASIQKSIQSLSLDPDWGAPFTYDIKINRSGKDQLTKYTVNPVPHKPLDPNIIAKFKEKPCNLNALFFNEDPFAVKGNCTPLAFEAVA